jgi:hypothetical protein
MPPLDIPIMGTTLSTLTTSPETVSIALALYVLQYSLPHPHPPLPCPIMSYAKALVANKNMAKLKAVVNPKLFLLIFPPVDLSFPNLFAIVPL